MMSYKEQLLNEPNYVPCKKSTKKIVGSVIYYIVGAVLSLFFILPLLYMFAASTKSEQSIAFSNGNIMMFIPDFARTYPAKPLTRTLKTITIAAYIKLLSAYFQIS